MVNTNDVKRGQTKITIMYKFDKNTNSMHPQVINTCIDKIKVNVVVVLW